jgi:hypothetical protein
MQDYQGNSRNKNKEEKPKDQPPKVVEKVVVGEVIVQKRTLGRKFKDVVALADFRGVSRYIIYDVLVPAFRNMMVDGATQGIERLVYGESSIRRRNYGPGPDRTHITYNSPINRGYRDVRGPRFAPPISALPRRSVYNQNDVIISSREEAEIVLERMGDIIDRYEVASVADLNDLLGVPTRYTDNKWGWIDLRDVPIRQIREGFLLDLPPAEPIPNI